MQTYEPLMGTDITRSCIDLVALAEKSNDTATMDFNDIAVTANPGDRPEALAAAYLEETERRHEAYLASPEYAQRLIDAEEAARVREKAAEKALSSAPATMTLRDGAKWQASVDANQDGYGACALRYAERWARMMEGAMANGETLAACVDRISHLADTEGITGYMQGAAVAILSQVWQYGDDLRAALGR